MTEQEEKRIAYHLLGILQEYAPDAAAQVLCVNAYKLAQQHSTPRQLVRTMVNCLADGLNYGNWPWV